MKLSTLTPGDAVLAGYRNWLTPSTFVGFELTYNGTRFSTLKELKAETGCRNLSELEAFADSQDNSSVYATFRDEEDDQTWSAYLWKNRWRVGTSADILQLR